MIITSEKLSIYMIANPEASGRAIRAARLRQGWDQEIFGRKFIPRKLRSEVYRYERGKSTKLYEDGVSVEELLEALKIEGNIFIEIINRYKANPRRIGILATTGYNSSNLVETAKYFRLKNNITQKDFTNKYKERGTFVSNLGKDGSNPTLSTLITFCKATKIKISDFFLYLESLSSHEEGQ